MERLGQLEFRRAVLGTLLQADGPLSIGDVIERLEREQIEIARPSGNAAKVVGDLLAYQARVGRVQRTQRGTYVVVPSRMSKSTRWRCVHWRHASGTSPVT